MRISPLLLPKSKVPLIVIVRRFEVLAGGDLTGLVRPAFGFPSADCVVFVEVFYVRKPLNTMPLDASELSLGF